VIDNYGSSDSSGGGDEGRATPEAILEHISQETSDAALFPGTMREVWYFAYDLMMEQATVSRFTKKMHIGKVVSLPHYKLEFAYHFPPQGTSLPTLTRTNNPDDVVWGFVYDAREKDFSEIERYLRTPHRYHRSAIQVQDRGGRRMPAFTYVLTLRDDVYRNPAKSYMDKVIAAGTERKLPKEWLDKLRDWETEDAETAAQAGG